MEQIIEKLKQTARDSWKGETGEERAKHLESFLRTKLKNYSEKTGLSELEILKGWEEQRTYSAINFYQESNQPEIKADKVIIAESSEDFFKKFPSRKWICPNCKGISKDPFLCDSGIKLKLINGSNKKEICNWSAGGLFGTFGEGVHVFLKDKMKLVGIFKPIELIRKINERGTGK